MGLVRVFNIESSFCCKVHEEFKLSVRTLKFTFMIALMLCIQMPNHANGEFGSNPIDDVITVQFRSDLGVIVEEGKLHFNDEKQIPADLAAVLNSLEWFSPFGDKYLNHRAKYYEVIEKNKEARIRDVSSRFSARIGVLSDHLEETIALLRTFEEIEYAYRTPDPVTPPAFSVKEKVQMIPPNYQTNQGYLNESPTGIDALYVWENYGNRGAGINIVDIEYDFSNTHHDLPPINVIGGVPYTAYGNDHGTAVLGEYGSINNEFGTTGIASDAICHFQYGFVNAFSLDYGSATVNAAEALNPGDIILLEAQTGGPNYSGSGQNGLVPIEWFEPWYDGVVFAIDVYNVVVVEAAGNGNENLDAAIYIDNPEAPHNPFLQENNSGAIIVGAGHSPSQFGGGGVPRSRMWYSNYGSRLDLQAWGERIYSTGYGNIYNAEGVNYYFTNSFSGTSGASPIVVGAAALLQAQSKNITGNVLTGVEIRDAFFATGAPQQGGSNPVTQNIGPMPNLQAAIIYLGLDQMAPNNDLCADAIELFCSEVVTGNINTASSDDAPDNCSGGDMETGVWYVFQGNETITTLSLCGADFDTQLGVYEGTCDNLNCVGYNDDFCGQQSSVEFYAEAGKQYYIYVSGKSGGVGEFSMEVTCFECSSIEYLVQSTSTSCGFDNGSIYVTIDGFNNFNVEWSDGFSSVLREELAPGLYEGVITTMEGCVFPFSEYIASSEPIEALVFTENTTCGLDNGTAEVLEPISQNTLFYWSNGVEGYKLVDLPAGHYSVTVVDDFGCMAEAEAFIGNSSPLDFDYEVSHTTCGMNNGGIHLDLPGESEDYIVVWSHGSNDIEINHLSAGTYSVVVESSEGCSTEKTIEVLNSSVLDVVVEINHESCFGCKDGSLSVIQPIGAGYSYFWSNSENSSSINGLEPGLYTLNVVDEDGCDFYGEYIIVPFGCEDTVLEFEYNVQTIKCFEETGAVEVVVSGGQAPYSFVWSDGTTSSIFNGLAGHYFVTVTDSNGCSGYTEIELIEPAPIQISGDLVHETCFNDCTGSIAMEVEGGIAPYLYMWNHNNETTSSQLGLCGGVYEVVVTDNNGCEVLASFDIASGYDLLYSIEGDTFICHNDTGFLHVNGDFASIVWNNGSTERTIEWTVSASLSFEITHGETCFKTVDIEVVKNDELFLEFDVTTDSIYVNVFGGSAPYSYLWETGDTTSFLVPETTGNYEVEVIDSSGCSVIGEVDFTTSNTYFYNNHELKIFPNPVKGELYLSIPKGLNFVEISVLGIGGKLLYQSGLEGVKDRLHVGHFPSGVYMIQLQSDDRIYQTKFIKID